MRAAGRPFSDPHLGVATGLHRVVGRVHSIERRLLGIDIGAVNSVAEHDAPTDLEFHYCIFCRPTTSVCTIGVSRELKGGW